MLNNKPNMGRKQVFEELPVPNTVVEKGQKELLVLIYKAVYILVKIVLDIRWNQVQHNTIKKPKKGKTVSNPVIKDKDLENLNG